MRKTVFLPVEVQKREWKAKLYLASKLLEEGYSVVIGKHTKVRGYSLLQKDGIYIDKSLFYNNSIQLGKLKERGFQILAWDEEGAATRDEHTYITQRVGKETLDVCDVILVWGRKQGEYIRNYYPEIANKIHMVGNPRIDLLRAESKKIYQRKIEEIYHKYGDYILINTNFGCIFDENILEKWTRMFMAQQRDGREAIKLLDGRLECTKAVFKLFVEGIEYLAQNIQQTIIIRPHPGEDETAYKDIFGKYDNVYITNEYEVNVWLHGASVTIHNSSTSGMESFIAGVPTISFAPSDLYLAEEAVSNQVSNIIKDKELLLECVKGLVSRTFTEESIRDTFFSDEKWNVLKEYINYSESKSASEMILECLDKREVNEKDSISIRKSWDRAKLMIKDLFYYKEEGNYKWKRLNFIEIKKELSLLYEHKGNFNVYPVGRDIYFLSKK